MTITTGKPATPGSPSAGPSSPGNDAQAPKGPDAVTFTIDDVEVAVPKGTLVIRAAEQLGIQIPRFCEHPLLDPIGACRQCLVEVWAPGRDGALAKMPKPQASCTLEATPGMVVKTQHTSPVADKAQHGIMEMLLINHPLDCPVCDKGGECPLQNQAMSNGRATTRFVDVKRTFPKPIAISTEILLDRERCILCQRCTRFSREIAGDPFIDLQKRGAAQQIGTFSPEVLGFAGSLPATVSDVPFHSYFSGNTIQICPVGALTSADYRFRSRPFDLVSTPSVAEHDACGSAIRVDHRRGKVMRRLAGDDPEVNEEWITDKDRFCFTWTSRDDRLRTPLVRNDEGELEPASWPAALAIAARGLAAAEGGVGVLTGGRLTAEDAFAYSVFARTVLRTNDIDFRSRVHSPEEADFLAAHVAATHLDVTYRDLDEASTVVLVGLEPEDEAGAIFLRLRKASLSGLKVVAIAAHASRGLQKMNGELVQTVPGQEAAALDALSLETGAVVLVGERLAKSAGAYSAALRLAERTGAKLAWVPRRAGDRGAVETGCLPTLLPGGRPVVSAEARADLAAAWGVDSIPATVGRDTKGIIKAAARGELGGLVVAGVEADDLPRPARVREALEAAFVVSLEVRESDVTRAADVVLPVAPPVEKAGTFVNWEGRLRPFGVVLDVPNSLTDIRVLAGIAEEMGTPLGFRTAAEAMDRMTETGPWDGDRIRAPHADADDLELEKNQVVLETWRQMVDDGRTQDGQEKYHATARPAVLKANAATLAAAGITPGEPATISGKRGSATFPTEVADLPDGVVWAPANNGVNLTTLQARHGKKVTLSAGGDDA